MKESWIVHSFTPTFQDGESVNLSIYGGTIQIQVGGSVTHIDPTDLEEFVNVVETLASKILDVDLDIMIDRTYKIVNGEHTGKIGTLDTIVDDERVIMLVNGEFYPIPSDWISKVE